MKNKKLFSLGLYREALRQTRVIGILSFIVMTFAAVIVPISSVIIMNAEMKSNDQMYPTGGVYEITKETVTGFVMNPLLFFVFLAIVPAMTFVLFDFLNKRNTSDFYHSIPHTRLCVYISFVLAILTWTVALIVSTSAISSLVYALLGKYFIPVYSTLIKYAVGCFIVSLLVVSATTLAMSITGTTLTNLVLVCLILFVPRICYFVFDASLASSIDILVQGHVLPLSGKGYNMLTDIFMSAMGLMGSYDMLDIFFSLSGIIYTTVLSLIYACLAAFFFCRRKSEAAGRSAPSRRLQNVYRYAVTMVVCFISIAMILSSRRSLDESDIIGIVIIYLIALLAYFVYELITTKKIKNLARAIPGLLVVVLLNAVLIGAGSITKSSALSYTPSPDEIESIQVQNGFSDYVYSLNLDYIEYKQYVYSDYKITDPEIKEIVSNTLRANVNTIKSKKSIWSQTEYTTEATVIIGGKGSAKYRNIYMSADDYSKLSYALFDNEDFRNNFTKLPDDYTSVYFISNIEGGHLSSSEAEEIYKKLKEELADISYDTLYEELSKGTGNDIQLEVNTLVKNRNVSITIPILGNICPETYNLCLAKIASGVKNSFDDMLEDLKEIQNAPGVSEDKLYDEWADISFYIYDKENECYHYASFYLDKSSNKSANVEIDKLFNTVSASISSNTPKYGESYIVAQFTKLSDDKYEGDDYYVQSYESETYLINIGDADRESIQKAVDRIASILNGEISMGSDTGVIE